MGVYGAAERGGRWHGGLDDGWGGSSLMRDGMHGIAWFACIGFTFMRDEHGYRGRAWAHYLCIHWLARFVSIVSFIDGACMTFFPNSITLLPFNLKQLLTQVFLLL